MYFMFCNMPVFRALFEKYDAFFEEKIRKNKDIKFFSKHVMRFSDKRRGENNNLRREEADPKITTDALNPVRCFHVTKRYSCMSALFSGVVLLAACNTQNTHLVEKITSQNVITPNQCAGWEKMNLKNRSRYYLMEQDQRLLVNIEAHNARGQKIGCWQ